MAPVDMKATQNGLHDVAEVMGGQQWRHAFGREHVTQDADDEVRTLGRGPATGPWDTPAAMNYTGKFIK